MRPEVAPQSFRDAAGNLIAYGDRWGMSSPPDDTYSVLTHPERFQPLHDIARALIAHLERTYDVTLSEIRAPCRRVRALRQPRPQPSTHSASPRCAPITFIFTELPGVVAMAGALLDEPFPSCGCDACDEGWESLADDLEWWVTAMVEGGLTEQVTQGPRTKVSHRLEGADAWRSAEGPADARITRRELAAARDRLAPLDGGRWEPWRPRGENSIAE